MSSRLVRLALVLLLGACGESFFSGEEGDPCVRSHECAPGLSCVQSVCSGDPTGIGGQVPTLDAAADAASGDAGDAGPTDASTLDSSGPADSSVPDADAAAPPDASNPPDASAPDAAQPDASMEPDAAVEPDGSMEPDAAVDPDAG